MRLEQQEIWSCTSVYLWCTKVCPFGATSTNRQGQQRQDFFLGSPLFVTCDQGVRTRQPHIYVCICVLGWSLSLFTRVSRLFRANCNLTSWGLVCILLCIVPFCKSPKASFICLVVQQFKTPEFPMKKEKKKKKLRRQWKPLPTLIKEKEPLWYRVPKVRNGYIAIYASGGHLSGSLEKSL